MAETIRIYYPRDFVFNRLSEFRVYETEVDLDSTYKDIAPAFTVSERLSDGKFFGLSWGKHIAHHSEGEHEFDEYEAVEVKKIDRVITISEWVPVE